MWNSGKQENKPANIPEFLMQRLRSNSQASNSILFWAVGGSTKT
jgi:hypothetical protein